MAKRRGKGITAAQKAARRKNIAVARKARKGGSIKIDPTSKKGAAFLTAALKEGVVKMSGRKRKGTGTAPLTPKIRAHLKKMGRIK